MSCRCGTIECRPEEIVDGRNVGAGRGHQRSNLKGEETLFKLFTFKWMILFFFCPFCLYSPPMFFIQNLPGSCYELQKTVKNGIILSKLDSMTNKKLGNICDDWLNLRQKEQYFKRFKNIIMGKQNLSKTLKAFLLPGCIRSCRPCGGECAIRRPRCWPCVGTSARSHGKSLKWEENYSENLTSYFFNQLLMIIIFLK